MFIVHISGIKDVNFSDSEDDVMILWFLSLSNRLRNFIIFEIALGDDNADFR